MSLSERYLEHLKVELCQPPLELMRQVIRRHLECFSFNNVDILLKPDSILSLETEDLFHKIVTQGRGGYCFEHNKLLFVMLEELGFEVQSFLGRVVYGSLEDKPRTHRMTLLKVDGGEYLLDVGFGPNTPTTPVPLKGDGSELYWIKGCEREGTLELMTRMDGKPFTLYSFDRGVYRESDFSVANFYTNRHPDSKFTQNLIVSRRTEERTYLVTGLKFVEHSTPGRPVTDITSAEHLGRVLRETMKLSLNEAEVETLYQFCERRETERKTTSPA